MTKEKKSKMEEVHDLLVSLQTIPVDDDDDLEESQPFVVKQVDSSFEGPNANQEFMRDLEVGRQ